MKIKISVYLVVAAAFFLTASNVFAGGFCCQMPNGAGASSGASMMSGDVTLQADYTYNRMSRFVSGGDYVSLHSVLQDPRFKPMKGTGVVPEVMDMHRITLTAAYAPTDRLRAVLCVPWVINDMTMRMWMMGKWTRETMDEVSGLGDVTLTGYYNIWQDRDVKPTMALTFGAGVKFPTGSSTVSQDGKRIHAHMQPGTGSWDPLLSLSFMDMISPKFLLQADVNYRVANKNSLGYSYGDTAAVNANLNYNVANYMNVSLGAGYFHSEQADDPNNKYNGQNPHRLTDYVGYTGEDSVWITPGVAVIPFPGAAIDLKFSYPVYYHVPDIEQVTDWRLTAGISYSF